MNEFLYLLIIGDNEGKTEELHYECRFFKYKVSPKSWFLDDDGDHGIEMDLQQYKTQKDMGKTNSQYMFTLEMLKDALKDEFHEAIDIVHTELNDMTKENWETKRRKILEVLPLPYLSNHLDYKGKAKELQFYFELCFDFAKKYQNVKLITGSR